MGGFGPEGRKDGVGQEVEWMVLDALGAMNDFRCLRCPR